MEKIEISIIVPCYNVEQYIKDCIESVRMQTFVQYELILVDDGSTDTTGRVCDEYSLIDERIKVIHQSNQGVTASRSEGLKQAEGEYVMFIDGDDFLISNDTFEKCYDSVTSDPDIDFVQFPFAVVKNGVVDLDNIHKPVNSFTNPSGIFKGMFVKSELKGYLWGKLYKKSVFGLHPFRDGFSMGEDALFFVDNINKLKKCKIISDGLYGYVQRQNSGARTWNSETAYQLSVMYLEVLKKCIEFDMPSESISNYYIKSFLGIAESRHGDELVEALIADKNFVPVITEQMDVRAKRWCRIIRLLGVTNSYKLFRIIKQVMR